MLHALLFIALLVSSACAIPLNDLFPFGPQVGDAIMNRYNISNGPLYLPHAFPYFDDNYHEIWITRNGLFSFFRPEYYYPSSFPLHFDGALVAGFWHSDIWPEVNRTGNKIYYQIHSNTSSSNFSVEVFNKASDYVRRFFPQQRPFIPKTVITGTWYFINPGYNATHILNSTFQTVLCTDGDRSFVFFLYHDLQWADPYGFTYYYSQAGLHSSKRNISEPLPYSGTEDVVKLAHESNVNVPGLFVFRIDADQINSGGCNESGSMISFRPRTSSQLGSSSLIIYGPCFTNETKVKCRFGSSTQMTDGLIIDEFRAICLTPFTSTHERLSLHVSIDNGQTFVLAGTFTPTPLQLGSDEVIIEPEGSDNLLTASQHVKLTWHFSELVSNTFPAGTKIDIELWPVSLNQQSKLQKVNAPITLASNMNRTDSARLLLPSSISNVSTCFIRVVARFNNTIYAGLNTGLLIVKSHPSLALESCGNWAAQQPGSSTWNGAGLLPCPLTRWQAIAAGRCCYELDRQCHIGRPNPKNCWLHRARPGHDEPSAVECYVSITSNSNGAGAECCYDDDHMLITRGTGAGTDDRYRQATSPVQHFFHDVLPYVQCCIMNTNAEACNTYMYYRPPRRGSNTMGENGRMWGDPHFGTLDGSSYTFNGHGEYIYLAISNSSSPSAAYNLSSLSNIFTSQIRTVPISSSNATVTKGFAARSNKIGDESISITISHREQLVLHRGNEFLEFEDNVDTLFFSEMAIHRLDGNTNRHFSLAWTIGVTIEINVIEITSPSKQLVLDVAASVSDNFRERTYGLLGTYDYNATNDLRNQNGSVLNKNASLEEIHKNFGVTWAIDPSTSLFYYESDQTAEYFQRQNRLCVPSFFDPTTNNNASIRNQCNISSTSSSNSWNLAQRACYYDLFMTNDIEFAKASLDTGNELLSIRENERNPPLFNSSLPLNMTLEHGKQVNLRISAISQYPLNIIEFLAGHQPANSTFNPTTRIFQWTAIKGEDYVSVEAHDRTFNLTSKHDIAFYVKSLDEQTTVKPPVTSSNNTATPPVTSSNNTATPPVTSSNNTAKPPVTSSNTTVKPSGSGNNKQLNAITFIVSILGLIVLFYH